MGERFIALTRIVHLRENYESVLKSIQRRQEFWRNEGNEVSLREIIPRSIFFHFLPAIVI